MAEDHRHNLDEQQLHVLEHVLERGAIKVNVLLFGGWNETIYRVLASRLSVFLLHNL
jgi:hypothetical protein